MTYNTQIIGLFCLIASSLLAQEKENLVMNPAKVLIENMVDKTGNYDVLLELKDVEYTYTFHIPASNKSDISIERYIFDGEISWAYYKMHNAFVLPKVQGTVTQYYETNDKSWVKLETEKLEDRSILLSSNFLRKANYYWFTMMPKLLDSGLIYEQLPNRIHKTMDYQIVKIGFEKGIGEVQDDFILYINPKTLLVDQFLFTVKGIGSSGVYLMKIEYETVNGYTFMARRKVIPSNWDGSIKGDVIYEQNISDVSFNNGFKTRDLSN